MEDRRRMISRHGWKFEWPGNTCPCIHTGLCVWRRRRDLTLRSMRVALVGARWFAALGTPATKDLRFPRLNTGFPPYPILSIFVANVAWHRQSDGALEPEILCSPITH